MSTRIYLLLLLTILSTATFSQTPQQFSYQAVVRDNNNQLVANRTVGMRISILKDSLGGQSAYTETHTPKTNSLGIVQLNIGGGTVVSGTFASIPWSSGKVFVKTEMDLQGGTNYTMNGTSQLLSVPYSLYASDVPVSKSGDTVTIGKSRLIIPGSQLLPGSAPASLSNGLIAYYPFNRNANDESGNGNHGTVNGATLTADRFGSSDKAYEFNGVNNSISTSPIASLATNEFSISSWVNFKTFSSSGLQYIVVGNQSQALWSCAYSGTSQNFQFLKNQGCSNGYDDIFNQNIISNTWIHTTYVSKDSKLLLFANGKLVETKSSDPLNFSCSNLILNFGVDIIGSLEYFDGKLDDIRIYNRALTQEEITYLANN